MRRQKSIFLTSEGDAWHSRNEHALEARDWSLDLVYARTAKVLGGKPARVLEIGCGEGSRLACLAERLSCQVSGIDPSAKAVARARERGVDARQGTADDLPYADSSFDVVIFGFCLYLCDDADLFAIGREADRVLANPGWLLILDFEAPTPTYRNYHHAVGIFSRKMDNKSMFLWHPAYTLASHEKFHHENLRWTDDPGEWVSLACLRKHLPNR